MTKIKWAKYIAQSIAFACVCLLAYWACNIKAPDVGSDVDKVQPVEPELAKGPAPRADLVPIGIKDGRRRYTGDYILVTGPHDAFISCVDSNAGNATFIPNDSLNRGFIYIVTCRLDTITGKLEYLSYYQKDDFGATIPPGGLDVYDEEYENLQEGYIVNRVEYNASRSYDMPRQNKVLYFGFYWLYNAEGYAYAKFSNKFIDNQVENQFRQFTR